MPDPKAWGNYWRSGALTTFGDKATYQGELRDFWTQFFDMLPADAVLLDLGAGNGALEEILQAYCEEKQKTLTVHAVDAAPIAPQVKTSVHSRCKVQWHPQTLNESTGLDAASVDAVIGSYAFEYGDEAATVAEISRVLKDVGKCRFLMHHAASGLIVDSAGELAVLDSALGAGGMFENTHAFLREFGHIQKPAQLDKLRKTGSAEPFLKRLDQALARASEHATTPNSRALLDTLARGTASLIRPPLLFEPKQTLLGYLDNARHEYLANRARLRDMQRAAVDERRMERIQRLFNEKSMKVTAEPFLVSRFSEPVGWSVNVTRMEEP